MKQENKLIIWKYFLMFILNIIICVIEIYIYTNYLGMNYDDTVKSILTFIIAPTQGYIMLLCLNQLQQSLFYK